MICKCCRMVDMMLFARLVMGINYKEIELNSVGNKEDYEMYSLDFDEYLGQRDISPNR